MSQHAIQVPARETRARAGLRRHENRANRGNLTTNAEGNRAIDRAAREAGRDPREIRHIYNIQGAFTGTAHGPAADTDEAIIGPAEHWVDVLTHLALDIGFGTFVLFAPPDPDALTTFIEDVAPNLRERVAEQRAERPRT